MKIMALETFKISNGLVPPILSDLVIKREGKYNFRYCNILQIPQVRASMQNKNSFRYTASLLWNSIPDNFRMTVDFNKFKPFMLHWNSENCKCAACKALS